MAGGGNAVWAVPCDAMNLLRVAAPWLLLYSLLVLLPIGLMLVPPVPPGRGFWVEFGVGLGFLGLSLMVLQFALTARFRHVAGSLGLDRMLHFHRHAGTLAFLCVLAHPAILMLADRRFVEFLDPAVNLPRTAALSLAILSLLLVVALSLGRATLRIPYQWWRLTHGGLALLVVLIGLAHTLMVGHYAEVAWKRAIWIGLVAAAASLLLATRILKPLLASRRRWRVESVEPAAERTWRLVLRPAGQGSVEFEAGQCVWITFGSLPWSLEQHPFTIVSSDRDPARLEFLIKELGDFTGRLGSLPPGTEVMLEGPYGAFTLPPPQEPGPIWMVAGGIGITPFLSMLRSMRDRGDRRPAALLYAARNLGEAAELASLLELSSALDLRVELLLEEPPQAPTAFPVATGRVDLARLAAFARGDLADTAGPWLLCGPEAMMDAIEQGLLSVGMDPTRIRSERYRIA